MYSLEYSNQSSKFLKDLDAITSGRILKKLEDLRECGSVHGVKKLKGNQEKVFRIRIGKYRILYEMDHTTKNILVSKIDKRSRIY